MTEQDIVWRLDHLECWGDADALVPEVIAEILKLRREVEAMRGVVEAAKDIESDIEFGTTELKLGHQTALRAALKALAEARKGEA